MWMASGSGDVYLRFTNSSDLQDPTLKGVFFVPAAFWTPRSPTFFFRRAKQDVDVFFSHTNTLMVNPEKLLYLQLESFLEMVWSTQSEV